MWDAFFIQTGNEETLHKFWKFHRNRLQKEEEKGRKFLQRYLALSKWKNTQEKSSVNDIWQVNAIEIIKTLYQNAIPCSH